MFLMIARLPNLGVVLETASVLDVVFFLGFLELSAIS